MMDKNNIIANGINFMNTKGYHFPEGWIEACLQWLFEEHSHEFNQVPLDKWLHLIEQQWLFTDLRDLEMPSILDINKLNESCVFNGVVCLQIMRFEDISKSFYGQIHTNSFNDDTFDVENEEKQSSRRSLQLHLTDGINSMRAFEFESWNHIMSDKLSCGCKCQLQGPFRIRNGVALLKQRNIKLLGGEVEEMKNISKIAMLDELLQKNITKMKTGGRGVHKPVVIKKEKQHTNDKLDHVPQYSGVLKKETHPLKAMINNIDFKVEKENVSYIQKVVKTEIHPVQSMSNNTDIRASMAAASSSRYELTNAMEVSIEERSVSSSQMNTQDTVIEFDDDDDEFLKAVEEVPEVVSVETAPSSRDNDSCTSLIDIFKELEDPESESIVSKQYKVKAVITKFLTKLSTDIDFAGVYHWKLQLRISDGTSSLDCQLSDGFMESRIGFSAATFHQRRHNDATDDLKVAIKEFQVNIIRCSCGLFTLRLSETCDKIEVVDYGDIGETEVMNLKARVTGLG